VLTDDVWERTIPLAEHFADGVRSVSDWSVTQLGCRAEYRFAPARNGTEAHAVSNPELERYLHLHALNRGVLITPFHNMALMAPTTTAADVDRHTEVLAEAISTLGR
jgi:glutamate-1-semialdehyde 2,1-aminomutase